MLHYFIRNKYSPARWTALILPLLFFAGCQDSHVPRKVSRAFYFWKTSYRIPAYEQSRLDSLQVQKIYLRLADVDVSPSGAPEPTGTLQVSGKFDTARYVYIPTVFITARTLVSLKQNDIQPLAQNITRLIASFCKGHAIPPAGIQIDCDWAAGTKDVYFELLRAIRATSFMQGKDLSCTIRLHQLKYITRNGIPPVDRGMAMIYNLGNLRQPGAHNSIFSEAEAAKYLGTIDAYPLPLDIALPIFSWCIHFRGGLFRGILRDVQPGELAAAPGIFRPEKENLYRCTKDAAWHGYAFAEGDIVRSEEPDRDGVQNIASYISRQRKDTALTVALFHLDSLLLSKHPYDELAPVFESFH